MNNTKSSIVTICGAVASTFFLLMFRNYGLRYPRGPSHHHSRPYVVTHNDSVSRSAGDDLGGGDGNERAGRESDRTFAGRPNTLSNARCIADAGIYRLPDDCCDSYAISDGNSASDSVGDIDSCPCAHADNCCYCDSDAISNRNADERPDTFIYAVAHSNLYFYPDSDPEVRLPRHPAPLRRLGRRQPHRPSQSQPPLLLSRDRR